MLAIKDVFNCLLPVREHVVHIINCKPTFVATLPTIIVILNNSRTYVHTVTSINHDRKFVILLIHIVTNNQTETQL